MAAYDYYKISSVAAYASSEDSGQRSLFWFARKKKQNNEFEKLFQVARKDLKEKAEEISAK